MKIEFIILISIFLIASCKVKQKTIRNKQPDPIHNSNQPAEYVDYNYTLYQISNNIFIGQDSLITSYYLSGEIKSIGKFAKNREGNISSLRIDEFENYYENGELKQKGNYNIGRYTQCCFGGLCSQFYNYKLGEWQYYFPSGNQKAKVFYEVKRFKIGTSCGDDDKISFGQIDMSKSNFWSESGQKVNPSDKFLSELETVISDRGGSHAESLSIRNGKILLELIVNEK